MAEGPKGHLVRCSSVAATRAPLTTLLLIMLLNLEQRRIGLRMDFQNLATSYDKGIERRVMDLRRGRGKERVYGERKADSISGNSSRTDNKEVLVDSYVNIREGVKGLKLEQSGSAKETEFNEKYSRISQSPIDDWISGNDLGINTSRSASVTSSVGDFPAHLVNFAGSLRSRESKDQWGVETDQVNGFYASPRVIAERGRIPTSPYPDEGSSSYKLDSFDGHAEQKYKGDLSEVEDLEQDRAQLLRKLDELKERLNRSYGVADKPREMAPIERSRTLPDPYGDRLTYNLSMQPYAADKQMPRPPYSNYSHGPIPFMDHHNMGMQNFYPAQRHALNVIPEYDNPSQPQRDRRPPHHPLQYQRPPPHEYFMGQHMDFNVSPLASYSQISAFHSPACSCVRCYNRNWAAPPQVPFADFGNIRVPQAPSSSNSYDHVHPVTLGPHNYNPQNASPPPMPRRWQSDLDSDNDGYGDRHPRKAMAVNSHGRSSHPVAGGAPFIACFSCFELLKLPRVLNKRKKNQSKLRCGSCSTVISLEIKNKKLIISAPKDSKHISSEVVQSSNEEIKNKKLIISAPEDTKQLSSEVVQSSNEVLKARALSSHSSPNSIDTNSSCDDLENSGNNWKFVDTKENSPEDDKRQNLDKSEKRQGLTSSCSIVFKEEEEISDCVIAHTDVSDPAELPTKESFSPARPGSPLWKQSDSPKHAVEKDGKGNKSAGMEQDKVLFSRITSRQNSVKDRSVETEVDASFNKYLNTSITQDSAEASKEDRPKISMGSDSFLVGLIKKSFRDFSKSNQIVERTRPNVFINGQPLPDHVVKKAEKLAGPIQPGDYWYDFRAGFWGVMGRTCLGIIPPFIEEFYYPMPTNCAVGNTGVYVNGRELHQRDLDILASRGLPTTRNKFYVVEFSGKVVDDDSGEELDSLGKLAPTVKKAKHGFGMKVPRMVM